jgi:hypothetical protein
LPEVFRRFIGYNLDYLRLLEAITVRNFDRKIPEPSGDGHPLLILNTRLPQTHGMELRGRKRKYDQVEEERIRRDFVVYIQPLELWANLKCGLCQYVNKRKV